MKSFFAALLLLILPLVCEGGMQRNVALSW
jgi:hypothetical protein